ncbi:mannose-1-phosphate guanylyltransferase [Demequina sp.]|uniref:mannose-1-phosphate guanylyltransferase n=1 Tax=Demequina sp. TaxID=2050685 RepID=UPI003D105072
MSETPIDDFTAIVPAGGVGSRLWPLSRPDRPKFLLDLLGTGSTLIQETLSRLAPLTPDVVVVTGAKHASAVLAQAPELPDTNLLAEPSPRDSMAAIALAAAVVEHRHGPRLVGSFAADHVIGDPVSFREAVRTAVGPARDGYVVTIGIEPTEPSTAFGYIEQGVEHSPGVMRVRAFTEKPDAATARRMLADGGYVWNAGMFVVRTDVLLGHLATLLPALEAGVREIAAAWDTGGRGEVMDRVWPTLQKIAIDHAIAEPVAAQGGVAVVPSAFDWHDVGDFATLAELTSADADGVVRIDSTADIRAIQSDGVVAIGATRTIAVVGLDDVVVVETPEAILVVSKAHAQAVKDAGTPASGSVL